MSDRESKVANIINYYLSLVTVEDDLIRVKSVNTLLDNQYKRNLDKTTTLSYIKQKQKNTIDLTIEDDSPLIIIIDID